MTAKIFRPLSSAGSRYVFTYDNNYFNDLYQGIPIGGYNVIIDKLFEAVILKPAWIIWNTGSIMMRWARLWYTRETIDAYYQYQFGKLEYRSL